MRSKVGSARATPRFSRASRLKMALRAFFLGFCIICLLSFVSGDEKIRDKNGGFIDRLTNGMQIAKDFLGSESMALKVAEFVVRAFQGASPSATNTKRPLSFFPSHDKPQTDPKDKWTDEEGQNSNLLEDERLPIGGMKQVVKLFGLQPSQITAVAVNALLFVAQMISTFLSGPQRTIKQQRFEDSPSWILNKNSRRLQSILATASNVSLPDLFNNHFTKQHSNEETACIQLLICKLAPYVNKMQKIVFGGNSENANKNSVGAEIMYRNLPSRDEIDTSNGACEIRHRECDLNMF